MLAACMIQSWYWATVTSFLVVHFFWCIHYTGLEIVQPFGDDVNDLPIREMQREFNKSISALLRDEARTPPKFTIKVDRSGKVKSSVMRCSTTLNLMRLASDQ